MKKSATNVKAPDLEKDRELLVEALKQDLQELLEDPSTPLNKLAELAKVVEAVKKR